MGLFTQAKEAVKRPRASSSAEDGAPEDTEADDTSILCAPPPTPIGRI
jgi:hypothetical protein